VSGATPFQTIGPFFHAALPCTAYAVPSAAAPLIRIAGSVRDGAGTGVGDALLELWHPDAGFARVATDPDGAFAVETHLPRAADGEAEPQHAPHLVVQVFARGILTRLITHMYFEGQPQNATDPVLAHVPEARRATLVARRTADTAYRFDIALQGATETVFFDV